MRLKTNNSTTHQVDTGALTAAWNACFAILLSQRIEPITNSDNQIKKHVKDKNIKNVQETPPTPLPGGADNPGMHGVADGTGNHGSVRH